MDPWQVVLLGAVAGGGLALWLFAYVLSSGRRKPKREPTCSYCKHDMMAHRMAFGTTRCECCQESRDLAKKNR